MSEVLKISWRNLFRNKRRSLASLATVAFGAAGLLIYQGFNSGVMNQYRDNVIQGYYGNGQIFTPNYYGKVHEEPWKNWFENPEAVEAKLRKSAYIKDVFPRVSLFSFLVKGGITLGGKGEGVVPERENKFFTELNFIDGAGLAAEDEVVLGKGLATSLDAKVGDTVTLLTQTIHGQMNGADLKVAGIFFTGKQNIDDSFYRIHLKQAQTLLDTNSVELFSVATTGVSDWNNFAKDVQDSGLNVESIPFEVLDKIYYQNSVDFLNSQFNFIRTIILIIVGLGIFNVISAGLMERAGEIGALRANGESRNRLYRILGVESVVLGLLGGLAGVILATVIDMLVLSHGIPMPPAPGITRQFIVYLNLDLMHYIQALCLPAVATAIACIFPIIKLMRLSIPELMRKG